MRLGRTPRPNALIECRGRTLWPNAVAKRRSPSGARARRPGSCRGAWGCRCRSGPHRASRTLTDQGRPWIRRQGKPRHSTAWAAETPWAARGEAGLLARFPRVSLETPDHMDHAAPELAIRLVERQGRKGWMGGLQPAALAAQAQALDREAIAQPGDNDGAVARPRIPFHHQEITTADAGAAHGIATHRQQQTALRVTDQQAMQVDGPNAVRRYYSQKPGSAFGRRLRDFERRLRDVEGPLGEAGPRDWPASVVPGRPGPWHQLWGWGVGGLAQASAHSGLGRADR